jgi:hypothetical protein
MTATVSAARPALALVQPTPRPGRRALEFIRWAIDAFGQPGTRPETVIVPRSQTALGLAHEDIDSQGTVSWYMRQLRHAGVVVGTRPVVVDLDTLDQLAGEPTSGLSDLDTGQTQFEPPEPASEHAGDVAELLAQRAEQQARLAQLQAELALTDVALARAAARAGTADSPTGGVREFANAGLANSRIDRESRESAFANQEGRKVDLDHPPSFLDPSFANRARETREDSRTDDDETDQEEAPLTLDEVDEIVEPLRALCRETCRPDRLDNRGRRKLAQLGRKALTAGVETFCREVASDAAIRKPMGVFVRRGEHRDPETFTSQSRSTVRRPGGRHDDDCLCGGTGVLPADAAETAYVACPGQATS